MGRELEEEEGRTLACPPFEPQAPKKEQMMRVCSGAARFAAATFVPLHQLIGRWAQGQWGARDRVKIARWG